MRDSTRSSRHKRSRLARSASLPRLPSGFFELDREGVLRYGNARTEASFGCVSAAVVGHCISPLLHPDDRRARALKRGRDRSEALAVPTEPEGRIELLDGRFATRTEQFARVLTTLEDEQRIRSPHRPGNGAAPPTSDFLHRILVGVLRVAANQRITAANPEMRRILGDPGPGGLIGGSLANDLFAIEEECREVEDRLRRRRRSGLARARPAARRPDGRLLRVRIDCARTDDGDDGSPLRSRPPFP